MVYNEKLGKWIELFGMGIFRPEVTKPLGITKPVLAWGGGIERIAMLKFGLDDVREFYNKQSKLVEDRYEMPVVELSLSRLQKLIGKNTNKKQILDSLPFLGLDIESLGRNIVRVEYSPNRPDYSTDFGIALGLQGILGISKGMLRLNIRKNGNYEIKVDSSTSRIRPFVTGIIARNGSLDDEAVKQIINMQEDLHFGLGRKRKKSSIGIHDLNNISFPLKYTTTSRNHRFVPLNSTKESSISEILRDSEVGRDYGSILGQSTKVPIIIDAKGQTVSFPPIINAALTTVTTKTKNILVEVTGIDKQSAEDMLSVVVAILQGAGFQFSQLKVSGSKNSTPSFATRIIAFDADPVNKILGLNISSSMLASCLKKCRIDATMKGKKNTVHNSKVQI